MRSDQKKKKNLNKKNLKVIIPAAAILLLAVAIIIVNGCKEEEKRKDEGADPVNGAEAVAPAAWSWPYTGYPAKKETDTKRRPLCVKIENSAAAMPQRGVNAADVVYETQVEGDYTRFNCIFQSRIPDEVGPVRSARLSDRWVVPQYHGMLFYSGDNRQVRAAIKDANISSMSHDNASALYHRVSFKKAPHNLYLDLSKAYAYVKKNKSFPVTSQKITALGFDEEQIKQAALSKAGISQPSEGKDPGESKDDGSGSGSEDSGEYAETSPADPSVKSAEFSDGSAPETTDSAVTSAAVISWTIGRYNSGRWEWDEKSNRYLRWSLGDKHVDDATDEQIYTDNLVILSAKYVQQQKKDPAGNPTYDTELSGTGAAIIFKDGLQYKGQWKADNTAPPVFTDEAGRQIPLNIGKTWITVFDKRPKVTIE